MIKCDCNERIGIKIESWNQFEELKVFFDKQVNSGIFIDIPVELPYFCGYNLKPEQIREEYKWYADKWYKCVDCGTLWEFVYPDFPAKGMVRKFSNGNYSAKD